MQIACDSGLVGWCSTTPLTHAIVQGQMEVARLLLDSGADPDLVGSDGVTPLMYAVVQGKLEVLRLLVERGAALDATHPESGCTAFHTACLKNQPDCAEARIREEETTGSRGLA